MKTFLLFLLFAFGCLAEETNQPITFRYSKTGTFNDGGYISSGIIFWATNRTTNTISVSLAAIDRKVGSNWVTQCEHWEPLRFQPVGKPKTQSFLAPLSAGYAVIDLKCLTNANPWRARATVSHVRTGSAATAAHIKNYPRLLQGRIQLGNTNIPLNPFSTNITFFGGHTSVFSQEVSGE